MQDRGVSWKRHILFSIGLSVMLTIFFVILLFGDVLLSIIFLLLLLLIVLFIITTNRTEWSTTFPTSEQERREREGYVDVQAVYFLASQHGGVMPLVIPESNTSASGTAVVGMPLCIDPSQGNSSQTKTYVSGNETSVYEDGDLVYGSAVYLSAPLSPEGDPSTSTKESPLRQPHTVASSPVRAMPSHGGNENVAEPPAFLPCSSKGGEGV
ncbi:unnamed protein product [Phytomonas sp. EM1]|nr:unnamed protein product [Phytomonas sp. EM1]|eukprot:CCW65173.1 unnamed protein product [Phytomonas sp. isolate EM1]